MSFLSYTEKSDNPLAMLALAEPDIAEAAQNELMRNGIEAFSPISRRLVDDVLHGLSLEVSLGKKIADGYLALIAAGVELPRIVRYSDVLRQAFEQGTTVAGMMAGSLIPVLRFGDDDFLETFLYAAALIRKKWFAAMTAQPLEMVGKLIGNGDLHAGWEWLGFLCDLFAQDLTYEQFRRFAGRFPRAVVGFPPAYRVWRLEEMRRVVRCDFNLACVFLEALENQLAFLSGEDLHRFVSEGLTRYEKDTERGRRFLGLRSEAARNLCDRLQTTAVLSQIRPRLLRYLQARCGPGLRVNPLVFGDDEGVFSGFDGRTIYLRDTMDRYPDYAANDFLYKALAWMEAGSYEFGTYDFDFEKAVALCDLSGEGLPFAGARTDLERFFRLFPEPDRASALFSVFEYGRIRTLLEAAYPAGARRYCGFLAREAKKQLGAFSAENAFSCLYAVLVLGCAWPSGAANGVPERLQRVRSLFDLHTAGKKFPEASGLGVSRIFREGLTDFPVFKDGGKPAVFPFHFQVRPDWFYRIFGEYDRYADDLQQRIGRSGGSVYKSDIIKQLRRRGGVLDKEDVLRMINPAPIPGEDTDRFFSDLDAAGLDFLVEDSGQSSPASPFQQIYRYPEWDHTIGDYLFNHVLVREQTVPETDTDFFRLALGRNQGLVRKIRYAFELLKPEGTSVLRHWPEGEEFDYRQLLNFVVEKKSGRTPSERIYMKRLKSQRDVAVLLLLDFSRSTSNLVFGSRTETVMDIQKEAAVLFCEALEVVGDPFAMAGFSGTGRLGVDYWVIQEFTQPLTEEVRRKLGGVGPQRNTRMGAAIRHAVASFEMVPARSKLLLIISDGFPNDVDYKRDYALADTRRALLEARSRSLSVHAITVNISEHSQLDALYGKVSHSVISNVRQLPDKLLRIYGRLTG